MKRVLKVLGVLFGLLVVAVVGFVLHLNATWRVDYSAFPLPAITASTDPEVIKRGEYLVHAVAHCSICHTEPAITEARKPGVFPAMSGGYRWDIPAFGAFESPNLTPDPETGIGKLSDGQLARAIRHYVSREGTIMPFMQIGLGPMSDDDLLAVVSYVRAQPPVKAARGGDHPALLGRWLARSMTPFAGAPPKHVAPSAEPSIERGRYLANGPANCVACHTPRDPMKGFAPSGPLFSGEGQAEPDQKEAGQEFIIPNLTPDPSTGILRNVSEDGFVARFRAGRSLAGSKMPWEAFVNLTESDLRSLFRFLQSLPPVKHDLGPSHRPIGWKPPKSPS